MHTIFRTIADLAAEAAYADAASLSELGEDTVAAEEDLRMAQAFHEVSVSLAEVVGWVAGLPTSSETPGTFDDGSDEIIGLAREIRRKLYHAVGVSTIRQASRPTEGGAR